MIRVLNVDDNGDVRRGVARVLSAPGTGFSVVGSCETAEEALKLLDAGLQFELALLDLGLPGRSGHDVIRAVRRSRPRAVALAFTVFDDAPSIFEALRAGASGYLLKDTPPDRLLAAMKEALNGGAPMSPAVARMVVESFS
ncbi:MAG: response regulator transcription factor, partial [Myxococcales bacterium]